MSDGEKSVRTSFVADEAGFNDGENSRSSHKSTEAPAATRPKSKEVFQQFRPVVFWSVFAFLVCIGAAFGIGASMVPPQPKGPKASTKPPQQAHPHRTKPPPPNIANLFAGPLVHYIFFLMLAVASFTSVLLCSVHLWVRQRVKRNVKKIEEYKKNQLLLKLQSQEKENETQRELLLAKENDLEKGNASLAKLDEALKSEKIGNQETVRIMERNKKTFDEKHDKLKVHYEEVTSTVQAELSQTVMDKKDLIEGEDYKRKLRETHELLAKNQELVREKSEAQKKIDELTRKINFLQNQAGGRRGSKSSDSGSSSSSTSKIKKKKKKDDITESELSSPPNESSPEMEKALQEEMKKNKKFANDCNDDVMELLTQLTTVQKQLFEKDTEIEKLRLQATQVNQDADQKDISLNELWSKIDGLEKENAELRPDVEKAKRLKNRLQEALGLMAEQKKRVQQEREIKKNFAVKHEMLAKIFAKQGYEDFDQETSAETPQQFFKGLQTPNASTDPPPIPPVPFKPATDKLPPQPDRRRGSEKTRAQSEPQSDSSSSSSSVSSPRDNRADMKKEAVHSKAPKETPRSDTPSRSPKGESPMMKMRQERNANKNENDISSPSRTENADKNNASSPMMRFRMEKNVAENEDKKDPSPMMKMRQERAAAETNADEKNASSPMMKMRQERAAVETNADEKNASSPMMKMRQERAAAENNASEKEPVLGKTMTKELGFERKPSERGILRKGSSKQLGVDRAISKEIGYPKSSTTELGFEKKTSERGILRKGSTKQLGVDMAISKEIGYGKASTKEFGADKPEKEPVDEKKTSTNDPELDQFISKGIVYGKAKTNELEADKVAVDEKKVSTKELAVEKGLTKELESDKIEKEVPPEPVEESKPLIAPQLSSEKNNDALPPKISKSRTLEGIEVENFNNMETPELAKVTDAVEPEGSQKMKAQVVFSFKGKKLPKKSMLKKNANVVQIYCKNDNGTQELLGQTETSDKQDPEWQRTIRLNYVADEKQFIFAKVVSAEKDKATLRDAYMIGTTEFEVEDLIAQHTITNKLELDDGEKHKHSNRGELVIQGVLDMLAE